MVGCCSGPLPSIAIYLNNLATGTYCATNLAIIVFLALAAHLVENNNIHTRNITLDATPYRSGLPMDAIPVSNKPKSFPALIKHKCKYQSV